MNYENGFYIYHPTPEGGEGMHELSLSQVIEEHENDGDRYLLLKEINKC